MNTIRERMMKKRVLLPAALLLAALVWAVAFRASGIEVVPVAATARDVQATVKEQGVVESASAVSLLARGTGTVGQISVQEGDPVRAGDVLMTFQDFAQGAEADGLRAQAQGVYAQYEAARRTSDANRILHEEGAISYSQYADSLAQTRQLAAQLASLGYAADGAQSATQADGLISPIDGTLTALFVRAGESVAPGSVLAEVGRLDDRIVLLNVMAPDADRLQEGMVASVYRSGDAVTDAAQVGKIGLKAVDYISPLGIAQKRVRVEVLLPEEVDIRLGSAVEVRIVAAEALQVLSVPLSAVFDEDGQSFVFKIQGRKAVKTPVSTGLSGDEYAEITAGLEAGDLVVYAPAPELADGAKIKVKQS